MIGSELYDGRNNQADLKVGLYGQLFTYFKLLTWNF